MNASIKAIVPRYPLILILIACLGMVLFSINQIIKLAKPTLTSYHQFDEGYIQEYSTAMMIASVPNQNYKRFIEEISAKFPNQPDIASKMNISPSIANLPISEQESAIRLRLLEIRIEHLQNDLNKISETHSESLFFKLSFYFWSFLIWIGSVVIGRVLEHLTDKLLVINSDMQL